MQPSVVGGSCNVVAAVALLVDVEAQQEERTSHHLQILALS